MPRLRNAATGAVVSVSDETASRLGAGWVPADETSSKKRSRTTKKSDSESDSES